MALSGIVPMNGQENDGAAAGSNLERLSKGTLIVRLNSNRRKMDELVKMIANPVFSLEERSRFQRRLDQTKAETRLENLDLMQAFDWAYDYSKVLFMYDTASLLLKNGEKSGYFLDRQLEPDPSAALESDFWMVAYFNHDVPHLIELLDQGGNKLNKPFPIPKKPFFMRYVGKTYPSRETYSGTTFAVPDAPKWIFKSYSRDTQLDYFFYLIAGWNNALKKF